MVSVCLCHLPHTWVHTCSPEGGLGFTFFSSFQGAGQGRWGLGPWVGGQGSIGQEGERVPRPAGRALPQEAHVDTHSDTHRPQHKVAQSSD